MNKLSLTSYKRNNTIQYFLIWLMCRGCELSEIDFPADRQNNLFESILIVVLLSSIFGTASLEITCAKLHQAALYKKGGEIKPSTSTKPAWRICARRGYWLCHLSTGPELWGLFVSPARSEGLQALVHKKTRCIKQLWLEGGGGELHGDTSYSFMSCCLPSLAVSYWSR